ncbi:hypothetical protein ACT7C8_29445 [Bacillus cereus]
MKNKLGWKIYVLRRGSEFAKCNGSSIKKIESGGYSRRNFAEKISVSRETFRRGLTCEYEMDVDVFFKSIDLLFDNSIEKREIIKNFLVHVKAILTLR